MSPGVIEVTPVPVEQKWATQSPLQKAKKPSENLDHAETNPGKPSQAKGKAKMEIPKLTVRPNVIK